MFVSKPFHRLFICLLLLVIWSSPLFGEERLTNPTFKQGLQHWTFYVPKKVQPNVTHKVDQGILTVNFSSPVRPNDVQLTQSVTLKKGKHYQLAFDAKSDTNQVYVEVMCNQRNKPWGNVALGTKRQIIPQWIRYRFNFTAGRIDPKNPPVIRLMLGNAAGEIQLRRFSLTESLPKQNELKKGELPSVDLKNGQWSSDRGITLNDQGILTLKGNLKEDRKTELVLSSGGFADRTFYLLAEVRGTGMKFGAKWWLSPKIVISRVDKPRAAQRKEFTSIELPHWTPIVLAYTPNQTLPVAQQLRLQLRMEKCYGTMQIRNVRLTFDKPASPKFPGIVPQDPVCNLAINTSQRKIFNNDLLGMNASFRPFGKWLPPHTYKSPEIRKVLDRIRPAVLRFPGGTIANWYNYETDMYQVPATPEGCHLFSAIQWHNQAGHKFGFDGFAAVCREYDITASLVFNILQDSPEKCAARLKDRQARGLKIKWVELGNENDTPTQRGPQLKTVQDYIRLTRPIVKALKAVDPNIMYAINIAGVNTPDWGLPLAKENYYDAVVMHAYGSFGIKNSFLDGATVKMAFSSYGKVQTALQNYRQIFNNRPLLISEWGLNGNRNLAFNQMATLGTSDVWFAILDAYAQGMQIEMATIHVFYGAHMGLYTWEGSENSNPVAAKETTLRKHPDAVWFDMATATFSNTDLLLAKSEGPMLDDKNPGVIARAAINAKGAIHILAVNKYPTPCELKWTLDGKKTAVAWKMETLTTPDPFKQTQYKPDENPLAQKKGTGRIFLPPYSINKIVLARP